MERIDENGEWESDDGAAWLLVTPSEAFLAQRAAEPEPETIPSAEVVAAQAISDEISVRMNEADSISEIKLAITEGLEAAITSLGG